MQIRNQSRDWRNTCTVYVIVCVKRERNSLSHSFLASNRFAFFAQKLLCTKKNTVFYISVSSWNVWLKKIFKSVFNWISSSINVVSQAFKRKLNILIFTSILLSSIQRICFATFLLFNFFYFESFFRCCCTIFSFVCL